MTRRPLAERQGDLFAAPRSQPVAPEDLDRACTEILESLSPSPTPVDELVRGCQLSAAVVLTVLLELELAGRIERQPGNRVSLL